MPSFSSPFYVYFFFVLLLALTNACQRLEKNFSPILHTLTYVDNEGDEITIGSDIEVVEAMRVALRLLGGVFVVDEARVS